MRQGRAAAVCLLCSALGHGWALSATQLSQRPRRAPAPEPVSLQVIARAVPPPAPEEVAPVTKPIVNSSVATARRAPKLAVAEPETEPTAPAPEASGQTLVGPDSSSWSAPQGSGSSRAGAFTTGASGAAPPPRVAPAAAAARRATTPLAELARRPVPPPLGANLERNYPPEPRRLGRSGEAKVRALIETSGRVGVAQVASESAAGFGDACRRTLLESRWSAPLDRGGRPAATWVTYRCKFRIER